MSGGEKKANGKRRARPRKRRKLEVLVLAHTSCLPPDDVAALSPKEFLDVKTEHEVLAGLRKLGHHVAALGLTDELAPLREAIQGENPPEIVFNLMEEFRGQTTFDQNVASYLELQGMRYTGCNPRGLMIARDKALSKKILHYHRLPVPGFAVFSKSSRVRLPRHMKFPVIVKSLIEEASLGISESSVVSNAEKLAERVEFVFERLGTSAIVEEFIEGRELYVSVLGNERLQVLPTWELYIDNLREDAPNIATASVKWDLEYQKRRGVRLGRAEGLEPEIQAKLARSSKRIFRALNLSGYARIDYRLSADGTPYFLEANPNPDIGDREEVAQAAAAVGMKYHELLQRVLELGLKR